MATRPERIETPLPKRDGLAMAGGVLLATVAFAAMVYAAYHGWGARDLSTDWAYTGIGFGFLLFALGAFTFAYGWERGEMARAAKLTCFICFSALAAILAIVLLLKSKGGEAKGLTGAGRASSSRSSNGTPILDAVVWLLFRGTAETPPTKRDANITCGICGSRYVPRPPRAECPFCKASSLPG